MQDSIVLLHSVSKRKFKRVECFQLMKENMINLLAHVQTDFVPIGFFESNESIDRYLEHSKGLNDYNMYENAEGEIIVLP